MAKFESVDEVHQKRKELSDEYEGKLPEYLENYFDEEENKIRKDEFFRQRHQNKYKYTSEEKGKFIEEQDEKFWEENEFEIVKKKKTVRDEIDLKYEEPLRNEEILEEEVGLSEETKKILIAICEHDLYLFAIRYFAHYLKKPSSKLHTFLYKTIIREFSKSRKKGFKIAVAAPRSNAKTSIVSCIFPLWCIVYNKKNFIIITSDTAGQASDYLSDIKRELEFNALLLRDFPHIIGKGPTWKIDEIITNNHIKVLALGTGSKIRGRKFGIHRPDLLAFDDLENSDMVRSESDREFIRFQWFDKDVIHAGGEEGTCTDMLAVGTILGKDALLNAMIDPAQYPDWKGYRFQAVINFSDSDLWGEWENLYKDRFDENRQETALKFFEEHKKEMLKDTEVLWPEGDPYYGLMINKISNFSSFNSEKQNQPLDPSKILILHEELRFENFVTNPRILEILRNPANPRYGALDPSLGKKAGSGDYSCISTIVRDLKTGLLLVIHIDLKRRKVDDQIEAILKSHARFKYTLFTIETNAFQLVVADNLRKISKRQGLYVPIKEIDNFRDKKLRFESIVPLMKDGTIIFDSNLYNTNQQYRLGIEQITTFTGEGDRHDDAFDAVEMSVRIASERQFKRRTKQNR